MDEAPSAPSLTEFKQSPTAAIDWIGLRVAGSWTTTDNGGLVIRQSDRESLSQDLEFHFTSNWQRKCTMPQIPKFYSKQLAEL